MGPGFRRGDGMLGVGGRAAGGGLLLLRRRSMSQSLRLASSALVSDGASWWKPRSRAISFSSRVMAWAKPRKSSSLRVEGLLLQSIVMMGLVPFI